MDKEISFYNPQYNKKIRGFTKLVLDNGQERRVTESENTFYADHISPLLRSGGVTLCGINYDFSWKTVVGGILLFNEPISNNAEYMPPSSTMSMTANACVDYVHTGTPLEMGSFVSRQIGSGSLELNYTWDTSHGNGVISSVCLSSANGGYIGYGNTSGVRTSTLRSFGYAGSVYPLTPMNGYYYKGSVYSMSVADGVLTVTKTPYPATSCDILTTTKTHTLELQHRVSDCPFGQDGKMFMFYCKGDWEIGGVCPDSLIIYDIDTDTVTERYMVNNTGQRFTAGAGTTKPVHMINGLDVKRNRLWFGHQIGGATGAYYINYLTDEFIRLESAQQNHLFLRCTEDLYLPIYDTSSSSYVHNLSLLDPVTGVSKVINGTGKILDGLQSKMYCAEWNPDDDMFVRNTYAPANPADGNKLCAYFNPLYLATINNLDTPQTKTDSDILQVTYTLVSE